MKKIQGIILIKMEKNIITEDFQNEKAIIVVLFLFEDEAWLDWLFSEDWSVYTMITRGGGWRNVFIILLLVCTLVSISFFLRLAYREARPYYKMKKEYIGRSRQNEA